MCELRSRKAEDRRPGVVAVTMILLLHINLFRTHGRWDSKLHGTYHSYFLDIIHYINLTHRTCYRNGLSLQHVVVLFSQAEIPNVVTLLYRCRKDGKSPTLI